MKLTSNDRKLIRILLSKSNNCSVIRKLGQHIIQNNNFCELEPFHLIDEADFQKFYHKLSDKITDLITIFNEDYPYELKQIYDPPLLLYVNGFKSLLSKKKISIIGGRNAAYSDLNFIQDLASFLSKQGFVIVSGLANGIDTYAHKGAGAENTIAVIASGIDICYPKQNYYLFEDIKTKGLVLSENNLGCPPIAKLFPRRNRIIVGLSSLTIASNVKLKSGSMLTCRLVIENNRDLIVIPGPPNDIKHYGSNKLISDGANIFTNFDDLAEFLKAIYDIKLESCDTNNKSPKFHSNFPKDDLRNFIPASGIFFDDLIFQTNFEKAELLERISEFEIQDLIFIDHKKRIFLK
ncbi:MAG: DNA-protecting protein DprA [Rickettsiales bacterium]|nr:DNA-protecting protein DprA [Rickettsiales bacterium]